MKTGNKYQTKLSDSHRPDLEPNGKIVECVVDNKNGFLVVTDNDGNYWLVSEKYLKEIRTN